MADGKLFNLLFATKNVKYNGKGKIAISIFPVKC
jgi:hypothetical protein